jgi:hypothetical protein
VRRLIVRAWALVVVGSVTVALVSGAWAWYAGEGAGTASIALAVPSGCPSFSQVDAHALPYTEPPSATCSSDVLDFGIPGGQPGAAGAQGPAGPEGPPGPQGNPGAQGAQGIPGETGPQGPAGADGVSVTSADATDCRGTGRPGSYFQSANASTWACDGATGPQGPQGVQGETGATGQQGPQGPQGPAGADGTNGVSGWEYRTGSTSCSSQANAPCTLAASCTSGKRVLGGGHWVTPSTTRTFVTSSNPDNTTTPQSYFVGVRNESSPAYTLNVVAICAAVSP